MCGFFVCRGVSAPLLFKLGTWEPSSRNEVFVDCYEFGWLPERIYDEKNKIVEVLKKVILNSVLLIPVA